MYAGMREEVAQLKAQLAKKDEQLAAAATTVPVTVAAAKSKPSRKAK